MNSGKLRVFIFMVVGILLFINQKSIKKTKRKLKNFTFLEFDLFFNKLLNHKLDSHYVGIASNKENCIYFTTEENKINFEYEVRTKNQVKFAKKLIQYAKTNHFEIVKTTYQNKMIDDDLVNALVIQILSNLDANNVTNISKEVFITIFNCDLNTKFDMIS